MLNCFTQAMTLNASGNLSIGNTNDTYKLDVSGTGRTTGATYLATGGGNAGVGVTTILTPNSRTHTFQIGSNDSGVSSELVLGHQGDGFSIFTSGGSGAGALTIAQGTTSMLNFGITGAATFSNSFTTSDTSAIFLSPSLGTNQTVFLQLGKNIADTYNSGEMSFKFVASGSSSNMVSLGFYGAGQKLNVLGNGNVGIGTTSPNFIGSTGTILSILGTSTTNGGVVELASSNLTSTTGEMGKIEFLGLNGSGVAQSRAIIVCNQDGTTTSSNMRFFTMSAGSVGERMRITSGGDIVVGGTTAINSSSGRGNITVNGTSAIINLGISNVESGYIFHNGTNLDIAQVLAQPLRFLTSNTERMRITSGGNVGIGTSSPAQKLDVSGNIRATGTQFYLGATASGDTVVTLYSQNNSYSEIRSNAGAGSGYNGIMISSNTNAANSLPSWSIDLGGCLNSTSNVNAYTLGYRPNGGSWASYMVVNSSGNVGIGSASPSYRLVVNSGTDGISAGISGSTYGIRFDNGGTFSPGMSTIHGVNAGLTGSYQPIMINGSDVRFGTSATERMRITSGGNVGIGTTSPNHLLQVTSSSNFGAALKVSDVSTQSTGAIALGDGSSSTLGIGMWRAAENSYTTQGNWLNIQGISGIAFMSGTGAFGSNTKRMTLSSSGNLELTNGTIKTGAPGLGDAGAIRLGQRWGGTAVNAGGYIPIDIDGTTYYINLFSSTP